MAGIFPRPFKLFIVPESTIGKHHQNKKDRRAVVLKKLLLYPPSPRDGYAAREAPLRGHTLPSYYTGRR